MRQNSMPKHKGREWTPASPGHILRGDHSSDPTAISNTAYVETIRFPLSCNLRGEV
jgi:hypothetical protein